MRSARSRAVPRSPELYAGCPQQVCTGTSTVQPASSRSFTAAKPTDGRIRSTRQVTKSPTRGLPLEGFTGWDALSLFDPTPFTPIGAGSRVCFFAWAGQERRMAALAAPAAVSVRGVKLLEVGDEVGDALLVLEAGIDHLGAGDLGPWVLDVFAENGLVPGDAGILVGGRIVVAFDHSCL